MSVKVCECDCFECRVNRHDICRHVLRCIKRPWTKHSIIGVERTR